MKNRVAPSIVRPKLFIVFGNQRTGSTLVASRLNSHPHIVCYEEVMLPWVNSSPCLRDWLTAKNRPQWLRAVPGVRTSFLDDLVIEQSPRGPCWRHRVQAHVQPDITMAQDRLILHRKSVIFLRIRHFSSGSSPTK